MTISNTLVDEKGKSLAAAVILLTAPPPFRLLKTANLASSAHVWTLSFN